MFNQNTGLIDFILNYYSLFIFHFTFTILTIIFNFQIISITMYFQNLTYANFIFLLLLMLNSYHFVNPNLFLLLRCIHLIIFLILNLF